ncbi:hypothetical protein, partial [Lentilactobacillus hilgardii]|uniref:hypothetical protein n=1 Tax=Lentilactobacillus hilgardii TaxID=1588 RepID=UPI0039EC00ED
PTVLTCRFPTFYGCLLQKVMTPSIKISAIPLISNSILIEINCPASHNRTNSTIPSSNKI